MKKYQDIFTQTGCISEEMLTKYISDKLSSAEKHKVEKHLVDCEMCSDAIEGWNMIPGNKKISAVTAGLNRKIQHRVERDKVKIIFLRQYRTQMAIAASLVVILGMVWFFRNTMSINDFDSESSEKIFADKFEPYHAEEESKNNIPVSESTALGESGSERDGLKNTKVNRADVDKGTVEKNTSVSSGIAKEDAANKIGFSQPVIQETKKPRSTAAESQADHIIQAEGAASDKAGEISKPLSPEKTIFAGASSGENLSVAAQDSKKNKENGNLLLRQEKQKQRVMTVEPKSNPEKDLAKEKKYVEIKKTEPEVNSAPSNAEIAVESNPGIALTDSASADLLNESADAAIAMEKYEQKDYSGANERFEKMLAKDPDNYNALFYSSVSYLSIGQTEKAIVNLNKVLEDKEGAFYDAAQWYLSLAYIQKNDSQNARKILVKLQRNPGSKYQKQADETLREMNK